MSTILAALQARISQSLYISRKLQSDFVDILGTTLNGEMGVT